jgi:subtilisin family serine protease
MKDAPIIKNILYFLLAALFLLLPCLAFAEEPQPTITDPAPPSSPPTLEGKEGGRGTTEFKAGEIIVKFRENISQAGVRSLLRAEDVRILNELGNFGLMLLSVPHGRELEKIEELKRSPLVEYAEPNYVVQITAPITAAPHYSLRASSDVIPNDPYFLSQQWNLSQIEAPAAWDITTGSDRVMIAFIDSGVDLTQAELKDKVWTNPGEVAGNGIDDDGNGFVDDVHGWDFVNWDGEPQDDYGHGTFVAGIASAETNNGTLIAGVSWGAEIMAVKVFDRAGRGSLADVNGGILYAADNGAKIINLSLLLTSSDYPHSVQNIVNYAYSKGALTIAGSGDPREYGPAPPDAYQYPAALDHVVSVAATDRDDEHPDFSTYNDKVDIAAPGVDIFSFWPGGQGWISDTGMAATHVSGLAALVWSVNPTLTPDQVEDIIKSTAVDLGEPGKDDYFGHGRIDASAAARATPHYLQVEPDSLDFLVYDNNSSSETITNPGTSSSTWGVTPPTVPWLSINPPEGYTPSSATVSVDVGSLPDYGIYTATITATSTLTHCVNCSQSITATVVYRCRSYLPLLFKKS